MPTWETTTDWDSPQSETGVHHEQPANTDWAASSKVEKGYSTNLTDLVAYYPLNEDSGSTCYDVTGNATDGTISGVTLNASGVLGYTGYSFDGTDDEVNIGSDSAFNLDEVAISLWAKIPTTVDDRWRILSKVDSESSDGTAWDIMVDNGAFKTEGSIRVEFDTDSSGPITADTGFTAYNDGAWHHIFAHFEIRSSNTNQLSLFIDGSNASNSSRDEVLVTNSDNTTSHPIYLGSDDGGRNYGGDLQDVMIFSKTNNQDESNHYQAGV